ncbi:hypothetical protein CVT24_012040 [Panaeolus cyanescens]|uniref:Uncharacterized protein n=1 Tax=Panaeolus cyanescens TaxID=181874 RepID=A0A409VYG5_9AGAR|nr:hypothetical protein CVT24_012040 [Panaeolus cyanescens]
MSRGPTQAIDSEAGLRLRLMTWLSLYDLLPQPIYSAQYGGSPAALDDAISPEVVRRCLNAIATQRPEFLASMPQSQLAGEMLAPSIDIGSKWAAMLHIKNATRGADLLPQASLPKFDSRLSKKA